MPTVRQAALRYGDVLRNVVVLIDGEMECHHTVTTVVGGEGLGVIARLGIGLPVPNVALTSGGGDVSSHRMIDGEVQGHHTVATVGGGEGLGVMARLGIGLPVPRVAFAGGDGDAGGHRMIDGQV